MKIDVTQVLKDYENKPIFRSETNERGRIVQSKEKLTLRWVISTAVNTSTQGKPMTAEQKNKAYQISLKVWKDKEVNLTVDDLAFIKKQVGEIYTPLVFGRVSDIFEGKKEA